MFSKVAKKNKKKVIKGQPHQLAWINDRERQLLEGRNTFLGGPASVKGPYGIRAYPAPGDGAANETGREGFGDTSGGRADAGGTYGGGGRDSGNVGGSVGGGGMGGGGPSGGRSDGGPSGGGNDRTGGISPGVSGGPNGGRSDLGNFGSAANGITGGFGPGGAGGNVAGQAAAAAAAGNTSNFSGKSDFGQSNASNTAAKSDFASSTHSMSNPPSRAPAGVPGSLAAALRGPVAVDPFSGLIAAAPPSLSVHSQAHSFAPASRPAAPSIGMTPASGFAPSAMSNQLGLAPMDSIAVQAAQALSVPPGVQALANSVGQLAAFSGLNNSLGSPLGAMSPLDNPQVAGSIAPDPGSMSTPDLATAMGLAPQVAGTFGPRAGMQIANTAAKGNFGQFAPQSANTVSGAPPDYSASNIAPWGGSLTANSLASSMSQTTLGKALDALTGGAYSNSLQSVNSAAKGNFGQFGPQSVNTAAKSNMLGVTPAVGKTRGIAPADVSISPISNSSMAPSANFGNTAAQANSVAKGNYAAPSSPTNFSPASAAIMDSVNAAKAALGFAPATSANKSSARMDAPNGAIPGLTRSPDYSIDAINAAARASVNNNDVIGAMNMQNAPQSINASAQSDLGSFVAQATPSNNTLANIAAIQNSFAARPSPRASQMTSVQNALVAQDPSVDVGPYSESVDTTGYKDFTAGAQKAISGDMVGAFMEAVDKFGLGTAMQMAGMFMGGSGGSGRAMRDQDRAYGIGRGEGASSWISDQGLLADTGVVEPAPEPQSPYPPQWWKDWRSGYGQYGLLGPRLVETVI